MILRCIKCGSDVDRPPSQMRRRVFCDRSCMAAYLRTQTGQASPRFSHGGNGTRLYRIWKGMRSRCSALQSVSFPRYAGRGIECCVSWNDFTVFREWALAVGYTDQLEIDRIDNDGDYSAINCRWVTRRVNSFNRSTTRRTASYDRLVQCLISLGQTYQKIAERTGTSKATVYRSAKSAKQEVLA